MDKQNIVRIFENWAESKGMVYNYGLNKLQNLLDYPEDAEENKTYCLHIKNESKAIKGFVGHKGVSHSGELMLLKLSEFDMPFFREQGRIDNKNKFETYIEPLYALFWAFINDNYCGDLEIDSWSYTEVTDILDANF